MTLFLTSSPTGCPFEPGPQPAALDRRNGFISRLRAAWPEEPPEGLYLAADPEAHDANDEACRFFAGCLADAGLRLDGLTACDSRNAEEIGQLLPRCNFLILGGGHVPTQNRFFSEIGLPALIQSYEGVILSISAGSMNAAQIVYAQPEEPGEAADPQYCRWMGGLGLTSTSIWPHYQFSKDKAVDGIPLMERRLLHPLRRRPRDPLRRGMVFQQRPRLPHQRGGRGAAPLVKAARSRGNPFLRAVARQKSFPPGIPLFDKIERRTAHSAQRASHTLCAQFPCMCSDRTHMSSGRNFFTV